MKKNDAFNSYRPAAWKEMQRWAQAGRPDRILKDMLEVRHFRDRMPAPSELLWHAFDQASKHNTEYLVAANFHTMFSINHSLSVRLQRLAEMHLRECDGYDANLRMWGYIATNIFPLITYISRQNSQLIKEFAAAKRLLALPDWEEILAAQEELAATKDPPAASAAPGDGPVRRQAHRRPGRPNTNSRDGGAPAPATLPQTAAAHQQTADETSTSKECHDS